MSVDCCPPIPPPLQGRLACSLAPWVLALAAMLAASPAWAALDLTAWHRDAAAARVLAENDVPRALAEARRLEATLPPDASPVDRAKVLNLLARIETYRGLTLDAEAHSKKAFEIATASGDKIGQAESDLNVALNSINLGKLDELVTSTNRAVASLENVDRPDLLSEALLRATVMYRRFEQFEESVAVAVQAMEIARRSGNPLALAYAHQGMAISYDQSFRQAESQQHYQQMLVQARAARSRMMEGFSLSGMASQAINGKDYVGAERLSRDSLEIFREVGAPFAEAFGHFGLSQTLRAQSRHAEALDELGKAHAIYDRYPNPIGLWFVLNARSSILQALKDFPAAQADAERGFDIAKHLGFAIYTSAGALRLADVAAARGDFKQAYAWSSQAREMSGQAARERASRRMLELTQRYESESRQRQIDELTHRNEQQTAELRQRELLQRWLWTLLVGSIVVMTTVVYFLLRLRRSHQLLRSVNTELADSRDAVRELNASLELRIEARTSQLRQQAHYLRTLIDMLPLWAWFKDTDNRYLVTNQAHARARGCRADEMVGKSDMQLLPPPQAAASQAEDAAVLASGEQRITEIAIDDAGREVWMECFKAPVVDDDGTLLGTVGVARDISAQKATEAAREAALEEARRLASTRSAFLAQMSHELRTPLNAILGFSQILQTHAPLDERQARSVAIIQQSGQHLLALINDVLDLARVDAGKLELTPQQMSLAPFLAVVADIIRVKADEKGLTFSVSTPTELPVAVWADEMRLRQVLLNVMANAVKFTDVGQVTLRVVQLPDEHAPADAGPRAKLRFEITDSGVGMSEQQVARLFQPFEQVGEARRRSGGTGLGLAISRELVRLMGGEMRVRSQPGQGSVFWFDLELPVCVQAADEGALARGSLFGYEGRRRRVLVVDDAAALRALMSDSLSVAGFDATTADNGQEALNRTREAPPDLILMDMTMPVMGGLEALRRLRAMPEFAKLPIIMTTASERSSAESACMAAGASAFLTKPIDIPTLLSTIGRLLELNWIHADTSAALAAGAPSADPRAAAVALPDDEMHTLLGLARFGNMREIRARAQHLQALDPRYTAFAERLRRLADSYQSQAILALVQSCQMAPSDFTATPAK
jgi:PAS domain S-box-containing protein